MDKKYYFDPADSDRLIDMEDEGESVVHWIDDNLSPIKSVNHYHTSYGLKHIMESDIDLYVTNSQFKEAMLICGYEPHDPSRLNWNFRISKRSPVFVRRAKERRDRFSYRRR